MRIEPTIKTGKERLLPTRVKQDTEKILNRLVQGKDIKVSNFTERRDFNATSDTVGDMANTLATLISDLRKKGIIQ